VQNETFVFKNAFVIFSLIDNVDEILFKFDDSQNTYTYSFQRSNIQNELGINFTEYSSSTEKFKNEFLPYLSALNWKT
jgi:hypothetical protein